MFALAAVFIAGCSNTDDPGVGDGGKIDVTTFLDGALACDPNKDYDGDGILNGEEGCLYGRDSDTDGNPDWQDFDSDGDGISDAIEAGTKGKCKGKAKEKWPCDSDGDGVPDYLDIDSDGDRVLDNDEDTNGDGLLGCCLVECGKPSESQKGTCILNAEGCGGGQTCINGKCTPPVDFSCSNGETSPTLKDTFGDGRFDNERGSFICRDATEEKPGRKAVMERKSANPKPDPNKSGDWHLALELSAKYGDITIAPPRKDKEAAAAIDHEDTQEQVAGFIISMPATKKNVQEEIADIIAKLTTKPPGSGSGSGTLTVRASGTQGKSHDKYDEVRGTILDLSGANTNVSTVRNELIATVLGRTPATLTNLPQPFGTSGSDFVIRLVTIRRFAFKETKGNLELDADGFPVEDTTKPEERRIIVMGAVALRSNYQDPSRKTGFLVDDLSNGTAVAVFSDEVENECDVGTITSLPVADIIWVIDESGSMSGERQDVVNNANNFFSRALASGLDFRMGVTNVCTPSGSHKYAVGKFCSKISNNSSDKGGTDRFLLPSEQQVFSSCINNPPGYEGGSEYGLVNAEEAVKKHLPRASNAPSKIRPEAKVVIIVATDEIPQSLSSIVSYQEKDACQLSAGKQTQINSAIQKYLDLFKGLTDPEASAIFHLIGGVCNNSCGADVGHGYRELAQQLGGQVGDVCQHDLGNTLQVIIDSIIGAASPVVLEYVPIASSLAVAMDGVEVTRSRINGFDYRAEQNSLAFINVKFDKGSEVVASYKRWARQLIID
ncbi:MAG: hypothetical protein CSA65_01725 [Proteobacteria bacterium]|nr:MAG: hypothetical protein CSB49_06610 [Pseudomonadota bacterium]PIE19614.1 MAG: hypothetical protein CSA65_01725 [Pseudomonadota bacterium]